MSYLVLSGVRNQLREMREDYGITRKFLCDKSGVGQYVIKMIESNNPGYTPDLIHLQKISYVFKKIDSDRMKAIEEFLK